MSDQVQAQDLGAQTGGQPAGTVPPEQVQPETEPTYVTKRVLDETLSEFGKSIQKMLQSNRDSTVSRVQNAVAALKERGYTDEEIQEAQRRARFDDATQVYQQAIVEPDGAAQPALTDDRIDQIMAEVSAQYGGVGLVRGDPETRMLDGINPYIMDEASFRSLAAHAFSTKQQRIQSGAQTTQPPNQQDNSSPHGAIPNPVTRSPGMVSGAPSGDRIASLTAELQSLQPPNPNHADKVVRARRQAIMQELKQLSG